MNPPTTAEIVAFSEILVGSVAILGSLWFFFKIRRDLEEIVVSGGQATQEAKQTAQVFASSLEETKSEITGLKSELTRFREKELPSTGRQVENLIGGIDEASKGIQSASNAINGLSGFLDALSIVGIPKGFRKDIRETGDSLSAVADTLGAEIPEFRTNSAGILNLVDSSAKNTVKVLETVSQDSIPAAITALNETGQTLDQVSVRLPGLTRIITLWLFLVAVALSIGLILAGSFRLVSI